MRSGHVLKTDFESGFRRKKSNERFSFESKSGQKVSLSPVIYFRLHHFYEILEVMKL